MKRVSDETHRQEDSYFIRAVGRIRSDTLQRVYGILKFIFPSREQWAKERNITFHCIVYS